MLPWKSTESEIESCDANLKGQAAMSQLVYVSVAHDCELTDGLTVSSTTFPITLVEYHFNQDWHLLLDGVN